MAILDLLLSGGTGGILGGITALGNNWLKIKAQKDMAEIKLQQTAADNAQELAMLVKQGEIQQSITQAKAEQARVESEGQAVVANINAFTQQLSRASQWIVDISASVRPILTYTTHAIILWIVYNAMQVIPINNVSDIEKFMGLIAQTGIFGAYSFMMSFWFVNRSGEKAMGHHKQ